MMRFSTEHLRKVFEDADKYENFKKLTYNLNHGIDIYEYDDDGNQRKVSLEEKDIRYWKPATGWKQWKYFMMKKILH